MATWGLHGFGLGRDELKLDRFAEWTQTWSYQRAYRPNTIGIDLVSSILSEWDGQNGLYPHCLLGAKFCLARVFVACFYHGSCCLFRVNFIVIVLMFGFCDDRSMTERGFNLGTLSYYGCGAT